VWQTPLARRWLLGWFDASAVERLPTPLLNWLVGSVAGGEARPWTLSRDGRQLVATLQGRTADDDWLVVLRELNDAHTVQALVHAFGLTLRESEVLYWVAKGKTNRDIGDILGASPATVKKHLERILAKLGVETRTAAAALALKRVRALSPA
jgi:DNA-binding CsgD family transcriptional regulator